MNHNGAGGIVHVYCAGCDPANDAFLFTDAALERLINRCESHPV